MSMAYAFPALVPGKTDPFFSSRPVPRLVLGLLIWLVCLAPAMADDADRARLLHDSDSILSLSDILQRINHSQKLRILDVELEEEQGRIMYEIELMDEQQHIRHLEVDAHTGKVLRSGAP